MWAVCLKPGEPPGGHETHEDEAGHQEDEKLPEIPGPGPKPESLKLDELDHGEDDDHPNQRNKTSEITSGTTSQNQPKQDPPEREDHAHLSQCDQCKKGQCGRQPALASGRDSAGDDSDVDCNADHEQPKADHPSERDFRTAGFIGIGYRTRRVVGIDRHKGEWGQQKDFPLRLRVTTLLFFFGEQRCKKGGVAFPNLWRSQASWIGKFRSIRSIKPDHFSFVVHTFHNYKTGRRFC